MMPFMNDLSLVVSKDLKQITIVSTFFLYVRRNILRGVKASLMRPAIQRNAQPNS